MKAIFIILALVVAATVVTLLLLLPRYDTRIDPLVDFQSARVPIKEWAIEREVVEAELAQYGAELVPALRAELHRGSWRRSKSVRWAVAKSPKFIQDQVAKGESEQDRRTERAILTLGRLRQQGSAAIRDLQSVTGSGRIPEVAQVALTMIQPSDAMVQSNAIAALTASSQPRRAQFALYANEIWPGQPEILDRPLHDSDAAVRVHSLNALGYYGTRASNATPAVLAMLGDPSPMVRPRAALALGLIAPEHGTNAVAVMLKQQRTNNSWTGDHAYVLYQSLGPAASAAVPKLEADLADPNMAVFHGDAAGALWRITGKATPQIIDGLGTGLQFDVQRTQLRCLRILREIGPAAAAAAPAVSSLTNHPRILLRKLSREALDSITAPSAR